MFQNFTPGAKKFKNLFLAISLFYGPPPPQLHKGFLQISLSPLPKIGLGESFNPRQNYPELQNQ